MDQHGGLNVRSKRRCNWAPSPPNASRPTGCKSDQAALPLLQTPLKLPPVCQFGKRVNTVVSHDKVTVLILPLSEAPRQLCKAVVLWQRLRSSRGAASRWFKVGLPAQRWSSIPTCRSQLYGHFTSLSVHGQETCQSKTPPWQQFCVVLWRRSRAPPSTLPNLPPVIRKYDCTLVGRETVEI